MNPANRDRLRSRVETAAEAALTRQGWASAVDVLLGIGWLQPSIEKQWRLGQLRFLEAGLHANLSRISEAMRLFRRWAEGKQLVPSETAYMARNPARTALRFSKSGAESIERHYRTHWVARELSEKKRERLAEKASRPPELVVVEPLNRDWKCHRCGGSGDFLLMEQPGPCCLACAGLPTLEFLPAGDAALTRRVKARSEVHAVVVRFSRARKRYERQGLLVMPEALREVGEQGE
jgi:hypothetical protein